MFNVCPKCGEYTEIEDIDPAGPFAVCPICHHRHPFAWLPLFVVSGASGTGKSTVCLHLPAALPECVAMETDILLGQVTATPDDNYRSYRNAWLRIAKNIGQGGRPVVLCGTALPDQIEPCPERRYSQRPTTSRSSAMTTCWRSDYAAVPANWRSHQISSSVCATSTAGYNSTRRRQPSP
jgi:hypothetical protein